MPDNAVRILEGLRYFAQCLADYTNQPGYGEGFNYEDFALEQFQLKGRGFVFFDATNFIASFLNNQTRCVEVKHRYVSLNWLKNLEYPDSAGLEAISRYDESSQYAAFVVAITSRLPSLFTTGVEQDMFFAGQINFAQALTPSKITSSQIRKRLNRIVQQGGPRLLILDTKSPDFMGANLGKWLLEIKALERQGKHINVIIDSDNESDALIPTQFKEDICTINVK